LSARVKVTKVDEFMKKLFDDFLARNGQRPSSWVALALRNWAHLDEALRAVK